MQTTEISKLPMNCDNLNVYLMNESLLLYSQKTQNVYGFEKESAALFLQIDEFVKTHSFEEITKQFPTVDAVLLKKMYDLVACKETVDVIFPKYTPGTKTSFVPISAREALSKINDASYQVQQNMDENKFELILKNLISLPKYTLIYSNLDEAVVSINGLLNKEKIN